MDPKGDQEKDQARRGALPGAKNTWSQGLEDCPAMSCHPHFSLCRLFLRGRNHGYLQHLNFMSLCPWRETALSSLVFKLGTWVSTAGSPFPTCVLGVWVTREHDSCCKTGNRGDPKKREESLSKSLTIDFTGCHLQPTRHFSRCFTYVISFNPHNHRMK